MGSAPVNKILPYSMVDGPGCRAAVFLQGCNLRCGYCHNPETIRLCVHCGKCVGACPAGALRREGGVVLWDRTSCAGCDGCIAACPHSASPKVRRMSAREVHAEVKKSIPFIRGLTVSGGECMLYPDFLAELFAFAKADGLGCLIDSNGSVDFAEHPVLLDLCDGVMLDVKAWDETLHRELTGGGNALVKENLSHLAGKGKLAEVRIVCLPGEMDVEAVIEGVARTLGPREVGDLPLKLIRFRPHGVRGALSGREPPDLYLMKGLEDQARRAGFSAVQIV